MVLDSFAGSGTTGAVAHKMGRRWIMVELGEHCHTHIIPRLKKVIDGEDKGGITEASAGRAAADSATTGWRRRFSKRKWGNWVISKEYNAAMLAEAMCKLEGFTYAPQRDASTGSTAIPPRRISSMSRPRRSPASSCRHSAEEVGEEQSLLICCSAFHGVTAAKAAERWLNLTLKKDSKDGSGTL